MSLGDLQADVLGALQKLRTATAREIMNEIGTHRELAYTTVSTVLDRLYRKGLVRRSRVIGRGGVKYVYSYAPPEEVQASFVQRTLNRLVNAFGPSIVPAIYEGLEQLTKEKATETKRKASKRR
mgnify:CR=1 FL=1